MGLATETARNRLDNHMVLAFHSILFYHTQLKDTTRINHDAPVRERVIRLAFLVFFHIQPKTLKTINEV